MAQKSDSGKEFYEEFFRALSRDSEEKEKSKFKKTIEWFMPLAIGIVTSILAAFVLVPNEKSDLVKKSTIRKEISTAILNRGNLRVVKQIYKNRKIEHNKFGNLFKNIDEYYSSEVALSDILVDINASIYLSNSPDSILIDPLNKIILEHSQVYPYDKLEPTQKDLFENIRIKIPSEYLKVQNDINKIADELYSKNLLVSQYLNRSNTSFWISIVALIFSLLIGGFQIYQSKTNPFKKILKSKM